MQEVTKNNIALWKTARFKFTLVIAISTGLLIAILLALAHNRQQHNAIIYSDRVAERKESFQIISELETQRLKGLTIENTYWDDMVNYINKPNSNFEQNILSAQLTSYNADTIWTYNTKFKLVSNINSINGPLVKVNLNLNQSQLLNMFRNGYLVHFYRQTSAGLIEVYGATVHGSDDVAHSTPAQGYFFIARQLDENYIKDIENKTKDTVTTVPVSENLAATTSADIMKGRILFYTDLNDETGRPVAHLKVSYTSSAIAALVSSLNIIIKVGSACFLLLGILIYIVLDYLIIRPLNKVHSSLLTGDVTGLAELDDKDTEFGRIAALIEAAKEQNAATELAAEEARKAKDALEVRTAELEAANKLMVNRELRMAELKQENAKLKADQHK